MSDFVIRINNESNPASLIVGMVYRVLSGMEMPADDMLRIRDEDQSEPDGYLNPASMFAPIELPEAAKQALAATGTLARKEVPSQMGRP